MITDLRGVLVAVFPPGDAKVTGNALYFPPDF
jgi:hypothetical protein